MNDRPEFLSQNAIDPHEARRHFTKLGLSYLIMTVVFMAVAYIVQYAAAIFFPALYRAWWFSWAVSLLPLYGVGLPVLYLCLRRVPTASHNADFTTRGVTAEKPPFGLSQWLILLVIAFGCMTAGSIAGNIIMSILSMVMQYDYAFALNGMVNNTPIWFTLICTCICAPFGEELLFRKLLIDRTRRWGDMTAILLSGLLFGLFHGNLFQFFYAALVGMVLAYVYTRSGSYLWCVAMHAVINFMGSIVIPALAKFLPADMMSFTSFGSLVVYLLIMLWQYGMLVAGITLFCVFFPRRRLSNGTVSLEGGSHAKTAIVNPGMIACLVVMFLLVIVNLIPAY